MLVNRAEGAVWPAPAGKSRAKITLITIAAITKGSTTLSSGGTAAIPGWAAEAGEVRGLVAGAWFTTKS